MLARDEIARHWPHAPAALIDGIVASAPTVLPARGITTPMRLAHFMAQISEESGGGTQIVESLHYTHAQRIMAVWPSRFHSFSDAEPFVGQDRKLANRVYNGRMGNRLHTDDGWNFRGRGLLQLTGRESYAAIGAVLGLDLLGNPGLACDPNHCLEIAAAEFANLGCLPFADQDDLHKVTHAVNGGFIGLPDRLAWLKVWKHEFNIGALTS